MYTKIGSLLSMILLTLVVASCTEPKFPDTPFITSKSIQSVPGDNNDILTITITFRDGYGDLGLGPYDTLPPFDKEPFTYNYHITAFKRRGLDDLGNPNFVPVEFPTPNFTFNGRFPVLKPDRQPGPIEGDLNYSIPIEFPQDFTNENYILPGDTLRFNIFIYDRDDVAASRGGESRRNPNKSNEITTGEVVVLKR